MCSPLFSHSLYTEGGRGDTFSFVFPFFYTEMGHGMYGHVLLLMFFLAGQEKSFKQWLPH